MVAYIHNDKDGGLRPHSYIMIEHGPEPEAPLIHNERAWWPEAPLIHNDRDDGLRPHTHTMIDDDGLRPHSYIMIEHSGLRPHSYIMIEMMARGPTLTQ